MAICQLELSALGSERQRAGELGGRVVELEAELRRAKQAKATAETEIASLKVCTAYMRYHTCCARLALSRSLLGVSAVTTITQERCSNTVTTRCRIVAASQAVAEAADRALSLERSERATAEANLAAAKAQARDATRQAADANGALAAARAALTTQREEAQRVLAIAEDEWAARLDSKVAQAQKSSVRPTGHHPTACV